MDVVERAARWVGVPAQPKQLELWERFAAWLEGEAAVAGGIGPGEAERVRSRHIADSLLFAAAWPHGRAPATVLDLGTGVGLPGIPLAILWPETQVRLLDRSGKRLDLARRAVRLLGLSTAVVGADAATYSGPAANMVVSRAAAAPEQVLGWARRLLRPEGVVVVGGSHRVRPAPVAGESIVEIPATVLDRPVWLRMMAAT